MVERAGRLAGDRMDASAGRSWLGRMTAAFSFGLSGIDTVVVALAGFLIRGGIVVLALPGVVLPSVIGLFALVGVDAFGIDGRPQAWFIGVVVIGVVVVLLWLVLASLMGSLVDVWLIEAALDPVDSPVRRGRPLPGLGLLVEMAVVRGACLLPLAAALAWAANRIYDAAYTQFTVPTDLVTPLPLRIAAGAAGPIVAIVVVWLATETVGAIAVRRVVLGNEGVARSIAGALVQIVRRPLTTAATLLVSTGGTVFATAAAVGVTASAFDWCRIAARNQVPIGITLGAGPLSINRDFRPIVFIVAALAVAIAWVTAAVLSGAASALRSAAWTGEVAGSIPSFGTLTTREELGLSGEGRERSGD